MSHNKIKELKDIMYEMENLTEKQLAPTLTEERLNELMKSAGYRADVSAQSTGFRSAPTCVPDCNGCIRKIDFCCKKSILKGFNVEIDNNYTTINYNSCLYCFVDPCPCNVDVTPGPGCPTFCLPLYPVRVIGCIQYVAFTGNVIGECCYTNGFTSPSPSPGPCQGSYGAICCDGSICVNNIISYHQCPPTCAESQVKPIDCHELEVEINATAENCPDCSPSLGGRCDCTVVKFVGSFTLPDDYVCPTPTCPTPCPTPSCSPSL